MAARKTIVVNGITYVRADLAPVAPVAVAAPATAKPKFGDSKFGQDILAKAGKRKDCAIAAHAGICTRTFSQGSSGDVNHLARIV